MADEKDDEKPVDNPEVDEAEDAADEEEKSGSKFRLPLTIIVSVILLTNVVALTFFFLGFFDHVFQGGGDKEKEKKVVNLVYYELPPMLVNLNNPSRPSFLKIVLQLELTNSADVQKVNTVRPRLLDQFQIYLRELRIEDLQGSSGIHRLREELLLRANEVAAPVKIRDVLFKQVLVQ